MPFTDLIYVAVTQALHLMMGCAPAGTEGSGKTEVTIMRMIGRNFINRGSNMVFKIGYLELNVHFEFRMYMQTMLSNPK